MGTYTTNYNLFMPTVGETGWGDLVNGNFTTIDTTMKSLNNSIGTLETEIKETIDPVLAAVITDNDGSQWFVNNASYNAKTNVWNQRDTSKASTALHLTVSGEIKMLNCAAGNSVITWSEVAIDLKTVYSSTGTVNFNGNALIGAPSVTTDTVLTNNLPLKITFTASTTVLHTVNAGNAVSQGEGYNVTSLIPIGLNMICKGTIYVAVAGARACVVLSHANGTTTNVGSGTIVDLDSYMSPVIGIAGGMIGGSSSGGTQVVCTLGYSSAVISTV